jgi:hypothetical protein
MTKITNKELLALKGILASDFLDGDPPVGKWVWSWSANPFESAKSFGGVVASLTKKGLAQQSGDTGKDACVAITQAGVDAVNDSPPVTTD